MKQRLIAPCLLAALFLAACDSSSDRDTGQLAPSEPAAPSPAVLEALQAQTIGSKLLGNTVRLTGDSFQPADLHFVPEAYFVYYSDSF